MGMSKPLMIKQPDDSDCHIRFELLHDEKLRYSAAYVLKTYGEYL